MVAYTNFEDGMQHLLSTRIAADWLLDLRFN